MIKKFCSKCKVDKNINEFGSHKRSKDGKQLWCKLCNNSYARSWSKVNSDSIKRLTEKSFTKFYTTTHGRAVHMLNNARSRAKRNDIPLSISVQWIEEKLSKGFCEVTGIPFVFKSNQGKGHITNSFSPSIDRIDQTGPYSPENCQVTCWIYNRAKGAFPIEDLRLMVNSIKD